MKRLAILLITLAVACLAAVPAFAVPTTAPVDSPYGALESLHDVTDDTDQAVTSTRIDMLTSVNRAMDGATVSFTGEAVGDIINGGQGHKWLNLYASGATIGVYVTDEQAELIRNLGDYDTAGTVIAVRGVYSIACTEHQGELDVHAIDVSLVSVGGTVSHGIDKRDVTTSTGLVMLAFVLLLVFYLVRRHLEKGANDKERS